MIKTSEHALTNQDILKIVLKQCAEDMGCNADDFLTKGNILVPFCPGANARECLKEPNVCNFISFGNNVVAAATKDVYDIVSEYISRYEFYYCFDTPNLHWLNERLAEKGYKICFMSEYYLPDVNNLPDLSCDYETRILKQADLKGLYSPEWKHTLSTDYKQDMLGIGAYDNGQLIGLAACSADCKNIWQMGVDVLPNYRRNGIGSALTTFLAKEILKCKKVPIYCVAWSNIRSTRNAVKSGFLPAWAEMTVKPINIVDDINKETI